MKYFIPVTPKQVDEIWQTPGLCAGFARHPEIMFMQSKKTGEPQKDGSIYTPEEMTKLKYDHQIVLPCLKK